MVANADVYQRAAQHLFFGFPAPEVEVGAGVDARNGRTGLRTFFRGWVSMEGAGYPPPGGVMWVLRGVSWSVGVRVTCRQIRHETTEAVVDVPSKGETGPGLAEREQRVSYEQYQSGRKGRSWLSGHWVPWQRHGLRWTRSRPRSRWEGPRHKVHALNSPNDGCWALGAKSEVLGTGCWFLGTGYRVLGIGFWVLAGLWVLIAGYLVMGTGSGAQSW